MSSGSIRIIQLPEKSSVNTDDYMAVDSSANGTKKVKFTDLLDDNLSAQNKAADAQATGEAISELNTDINNTNTRIDNTNTRIDNTNTRIDNMINTQQNAEVTTLWTGTLNTIGGNVTLSKSVSNFDFLDFYTSNGTFERVPVSAGTLKICETNIDDNGLSAFQQTGEATVTFSGTTVTLTSAYIWDYTSTGTVTISAGIVSNIKRIDGVKIGHINNDEIVDARVGANGVTYPTLGDAIRGQVTDLESELKSSNEGLLTFSTTPSRYINPNDGNLYYDATYTATGKIPCEESVMVYSPEHTPFCAWYDSTQSRVASLTLNEGINTLAVPNGASYFAVSMTTANIGSFKVYTSIGADLHKLVPITLATGDDVNITEGKYIGYEAGVIGTLATAGATDAIPVVGGTTYKLTLSSSWSSADLKGLAFYKDGGYISGTQYIANKASYILVAPNGANQLRISVKLADASTGYFTLESITNLIELTNFVDAIADRKVPKTIPNSFAFQTVGIVGDSLASGCSNYKDDQDVWHALDRKAFAWGKFLEKRQGCSVTLFSEGGMDTKTWFTSSNGYAKAQNNPCECYYIGLGVNDYASRGAGYLGTISDVHVGNEDLNADSFYGNYSKIIAKLTEIQPRCKIFCFTMPDSQSASQTRLDYDTAIRTVVALYSNAYLLDLSGDTFYTSEPITSTFYGAHYLATGYSMMADHILEITNKLMLENLDDFADIQWITNNYPNSDTI